MNFLSAHLGPLMGGGAAGLGATFLFLFREMIRDTWNDYRQSRRDEARAALARPSTNGTSNGAADRLGAEVTHQLMAILTQDLVDRKTAEEKNWGILKDLLETVKTLTNNVGSLQQQSATQTTLMQVIASRGK